MPRKPTHDIFEMNCLGYLTGMTDLMDAPVKFLHGHHRILFHSPIQVAMLAKLKGGNFGDNIIAGLLHLTLDKSMSKGKRFLTKHAKHAKKRKQTRK